MSAVRALGSAGRLVGPATGLARPRRRPGGRVARVLPWSPPTVPGGAGEPGSGRIGSKAEFFRLWRAGALGNRPRAWATAEEALASGAPMVGFRELGTFSGVHEIVERAAIMATAARWRRPFFIDEAAPDERNTLQGEICRTHRGWEGYLGVRTGRRMRAAMAEGLLTPRSTATVLALLARFVDPSSRDDLDALVDLFPEATIELAAYDIDVGVIPGRNMLVWECRDY